MLLIGCAAKLRLCPKISQHHAAIPSRGFTTKTLMQSALICHARCATSNSHGRKDSSRAFRAPEHAILQHCCRSSSVRYGTAPGLPARIVRFSYIPCSHIPRRSIRQRPSRPANPSRSTARNSRPLEVIGTYDPIPKPDPYDDSGKLHKDIKLDTARARYWIGVGAQPSVIVWRLLSMVGVLPKKVFGPKANAAKGSVEAKDVRIR